MCVLVLEIGRIYSLCISDLGCYVFRVLSPGGTNHYWLALTPVVVRGQTNRALSVNHYWFVPPITTGLTMYHYWFASPTAIGWENSLGKVMLFVW